eukprot:gene15015-biopygen3641
MKLPGVVQNYPESYEVARSRTELPAVARSCPESHGVARSRPELPGVARSRPESPGVARSRPESPGVDRSRPESTGVDRSRPESPGVDRSRPESTGVDLNRTELAEVGALAPPFKQRGNRKVARGAGVARMPKGYAFGMSGAGMARAFPVPPGAVRRHHAGSTEPLAVWILAGTGSWSSRWAGSACA